MKKILIIDIETTGFLNAGGHIVEIGMVELDLETSDITILFDEVCREEGMTQQEIENAWIIKNSNLTVEAVMNARTLREMQPQIQSIIDSYPLGCNAFNNVFDFSFMADRGFVFAHPLECPMKILTPIMKLPHANGRGGNKWPNVEEAWKYFFSDVPYTEAHRGANDAFHEAMIVYKLYKLGYFVSQIEARASQQPTTEIAPAVSSSNAIVKIDHTEFGIESTKAQEIEAQFKPMLAKMTQLEVEANEVFKLPVESTETAEKAKELRLKYVKVRTGTAAIHKEQKAFYLAAGRFIDGWKNAQLFASEGMEKRLADIENHAENVEKERVKKLHDERLVELAKYGNDGQHIEVGLMTDDVWTNYISGVKLAHDAKLAAEKKAELDRIELERKETLKNERSKSLLDVWGFVANESKMLHFGELTQEQFDTIHNDAKKAKVDHDAEQARIKAENERLKLEQEAKDKQLEAERQKADADRKAAEKAAEERRIADEAKAAADKKASDKKLADEKAASAAKLKAEQDAAAAAAKKSADEKAALEAELQAKKDAEAKAAADQFERDQAMMSADDADKIEMLANDLETLKTKYAFKSQKNQTLLSVVCQKIDNLISEIK